MKPFLLMDKSSVQGISFANFELIDNYYSHLISPILLRELISDLAKEDKKKSDEELKKIVSQLSARTNSPLSFYLPDAYKMACNNLLGVFIPMDGRLPLEHGIPLDIAEWGKGVFFDEPPEVQILRRWAKGIFTAEDLQKAQEIRDTDSNVDIEALCRGASSDLADLPKFTSLEEMVDWVNKTHFSPEDPAQLVLNATYHLLPPDQAEKALLLWKQLGSPELKEFAPYALHFYKVDMIQFLSVFCGFIKRGKSSKSHLDAQYLYYLPFCYVFTSGDNDLLSLVPFFKRSNQELIPKDELQKDLKEMSCYFSGLSEEEKRAYQKFGSYPPDLPNSPTRRVWEKFMRRPSAQVETEKPDPEKEKKILQMMQSIQKAAEKKTESQNSPPKP